MKGGVTPWTLCHSSCPSVVTDPHLQLGYFCWSHFPEMYNLISFPSCAPVMRESKVINETQLMQWFNLRSCRKYTLTDDSRNCNTCCLKIRSNAGLSHQRERVWGSTAFLGALPASLWSLGHLTWGPGVRSTENPQAQVPRVCHPRAGIAAEEDQGEERPPHPA